MVKLSNETLRQLQALSADRRARVDAIVRRHVDACFRQGFAPDNLERVYIEAIEVSGMPDDAPAAVATAGVARNYATNYCTPMEAWFTK